MKTPRLLSLTLSCLCSSGFFLTPWVHAQAPAAQTAHIDPVAMAPHVYKVIFENETVRVLEATDKPGDKAEMHSHPDTLMYVLAPFKRKLTLGSGRVVNVEQKPGDVRWMPAQSHSGENTGDTETRALFIEFKTDSNTAAKPASPAVLAK